VGKILLVVLLFAALTYTVFWLIERRRAGSRPARRKTPPRPRPRTIAPDDDEEFLRDLNRRRRRRGLDGLDQPGRDRDEDKPNNEPGDQPA
jgi:hypothetical protein